MQTLNALLFATSLIFVASGFINLIKLTLKK